MADQSQSQIVPERRRSGAKIESIRPLEPQRFSAFTGLETSLRNLAEKFGNVAREVKGVDLGLSLYFEGNAHAFEVVAQLMARQASGAEVLPSDYIEELTQAIESQVETTARMAESMLSRVRRNGDGASS